MGNYLLVFISLVKVQEVFCSLFFEFIFSKCVTVPK